MPRTDPTVVDAPSARRTRTRDRLIEAAYELFSERGVAATSVEEICERAGFTRGAFYSNFDSKWALFKALAHREYGLRLDRLRAGVDEVLRIPTHDLALSDDAVVDVVRQFLGMQPDSRRWLLMHAEFRLMGLRDPEIAEVYRSLTDEVDGFLAEQLVVALDLVGRRFRIPVPIAVEVICTSYEATIEEQLLGGPAEPSAADALAHIITALTEPIA